MHIYTYTCRSLTRVDLRVFSFLIPLRRKGLRHGTLSATLLPATLLSGAGGAQRAINCAGLV